MLENTVLQAGNVVHEKGYCNGTGDQDHIIFSGINS